MRRQVFCLTILLIVGSFLSCEKGAMLEKPSNFSNDEVCIYFASFNQENNYYTPNDKVVSFDEIIGYDPETHIFLINDVAKERIKKYGNGYYAYPVTGIPFVLSVKGEILFGGFFVPTFSSLIFIDKICIDPFGGNKLHLALGYPGTFKFTGLDLRNDPRLIAVLYSYNKIMSISDS